MDGSAMAILAVCACAMAAILALCIALDRRARRVRAAQWWRRWVIHNRVMADLWRRLNGPPRLEDHRSPDDRA
ncbi:hypothetical protein [uncultured Sphingomonas sp.]|uniref:hypothetical protein n=1 Tax=uncultured Sphingomonas sp. TaxID=158754 RepID=UPI0035CAFF60